MEYPATGRAALEALKKHFGEEELVDLEKRSGVSYETLRNWSLGKGKFTVKGKRHWQRIFGEQAEGRGTPQAAPAPDLASIDARLARIEQRLDALLTLRNEPGRIEQMVKSKVRAKAGGAA